MALQCNLPDRLGLTRWCQYWFGQASTFPLSIFRVCIGLVLLKTAILILPIAEVFYSDNGVMPRATAHQLITHLGHFTLLDALPSPSMVSVLLFVWIAVAVCILIGFQTRVMTIANFVLILSVHSRNPYLVSGADDMLRLLSFWMLFVPLNHALSLDAWLTQRVGRSYPTTTNSFPVRLMQLQVVLCYLSAGIFKLLGESWRSGTALYEIFQVQSLLRPLGQWVALNAPDSLLKITTYAVVALELGFVAMVFTPFWQPKLRYLGIAALALMHLGIALTMTTPLLDFVFVFWTSYLLFFVSPRPVETAPPPLTRTQRVTYSSLALLMLCIIWQTIASFGIRSVPLPNVIADGLKSIGLAQEWSLFAPQPLQYDSYIAVLGTFDDNSIYDLRSGSPHASTILPLPSSLTEYRWGGFQLNMFSHRPDAVFDLWGRYYCRILNSNPYRQSKVLTLQFRAAYRLVHVPGQKVHPIQDDLLWLHSCS